MPFDITTKQPQLFVCRDFKHLSDVLEEFASRMASSRRRTRRHQQGDRMQERRDLRIFVRASGSGRFHRSAHRREQQPIYLRTTGRPRSLSRTRNSTATGAIITRKDLVRRLEIGSKHRLREVAEDQLQRLGLAKVKKRRSSSRAALSCRAS